MEAYELVERFERFWPRVPKAVALQQQVRSKTHISVFAQVEPLHLYAALVIEPDGSVNETVLVFDLRQRILVDRLLIESTDGNGGNDGALLPLLNIRNRVAQVPVDRRRAIAAGVCQRVMQSFAERVGSHRVTSTMLRGVNSTPTGPRSSIIVAGSPVRGKHDSTGGAR